MLTRQITINNQPTSQIQTFKRPLYRCTMLARLARRIVFSPPIGQTFRCNRPMCVFITPELVKLTSHWSIKHPPRGARNAWRCPVCDKLFSKKTRPYCKHLKQHQHLQLFSHLLVADVRLINVNLLYSMPTHFITAFISCC